jgi:hypothetical protein
MLTFGSEAAEFMPWDMALALQEWTDLDRSGTRLDLRCQIAEVDAKER